MAACKPRARRGHDRPVHRSRMFRRCCIAAAVAIAAAAPVAVADVGDVDMREVLRELRQGLHQGWEREDEHRREKLERLRRAHSNDWRHRKGGAYARECGFRDKERRRCRVR